MKKKAASSLSSKAAGGKLKRATASTSSTTTTVAKRVPSPPTKRAGGGAGSSPNDYDEDTWEGCWEGGQRREAVKDGVAWLLKHTTAPDSDREGPAVPAVGQMVRLTRDPVRQEVLEVLHPALDKFKSENAPKCWEPNGASGGGGPGAKQRALIEAFRRIAQLEGTSVYAQEQTKRNLLAGFVSVGGSGKKAGGSSKKKAAAGTWSITDYLGWNPLVEAPPASLPDPFDPTSSLSKHRVLALSLELMYLAELSGLVRECAGKGEEEDEKAEESLGLFEEEEEEEEEEGEKHAVESKRHRALSQECRVTHVLKWLPSLRPYLGPTHVDSATYRDQVLLASTVVRTLSRGGELRIPALLLPHEYFFLREHMPVHLLQRDVVLVGRSMDALRVLGSHDENPVIRAGMSFLLGAQSPADGHWPVSTRPKTDEEGEGSDRSLFVATLNATRALLVREFSGFGPMPLEVLDLLLASQKEDADPPPGSVPSEEEAGSVFLLPDGTLDTRARDMAKMVVKIKREAKQKHQQQQQAAAAAAAEAPLPLLPSSSTSSFTTSHVGGGGGGEADPAAVARVQNVRNEVEKAKEEKQWTQVLAGLQKLDQETMSLPLLTATGVGKVVNKLKKVEDAGVAELSKKLVKQWKGLVEG